MHITNIMYLIYGNAWISQKNLSKNVFKNQQDRQTVDQQKHIIC